MGPGSLKKIRYDSQKCESNGNWGCRHFTEVIVCLLSLSFQFSATLKIHQHWWNVDLKIKYTYIIYIIYTYFPHLIVNGFHIYNFTYLIKFITNPKMLNGAFFFFKFFQWNFQSDLLLSRVLTNLTNCPFLSVLLL